MRIKNPTRIRSLGSKLMSSLAHIIDGLGVPMASHVSIN